MSTERRTDRGDHVEVIVGEPTWDNPTEWEQRWREYKAGTPQANRDAVDDRLDQALDGLRTYVNTSSPTSAQTVSAVKLLCRVAIGVIRLMRGRLDAVD